jgi:hypothetical protein
VAAALGVSLVIGASCTSSPQQPETQMQPYGAPPLMISEEQEVSDMTAGEEDEWAKERPPAPDMASMPPYGGAPREQAPDPPDMPGSTPSQPVPPGVDAPAYGGPPQVGPSLQPRPRGE